jgi:hypothetical protein
VRIGTDLPWLTVVLLFYSETDRVHEKLCLHSHGRTFLGNGYRPTAAHCTSPYARNEIRKLTQMQCDATETTACSECSSRNHKCQFTKETNRRMSSIKYAARLE